MVIYVNTAYWDDTSSQYVKLPLDDADAVTLRLARLCNGREMTTQQFDAALTFVTDEGMRLLTSPTPGIKL